MHFTMSMSQRVVQRAVEVAAARLSRDGAVHFVCMDWRPMDSVSAVGATVYGERLNLCIWNKSNAGMG
jgi:hypothetical protein